MYDFPCTFRGEPTGEKVDCGCGLGLQPIYACNLPALGGKRCLVRMGNCKQKLINLGLLSCASCDYRDDPTPKPLPRQIREKPRDAIPRTGDFHRAELRRRRFGAVDLSQAGGKPAGSSGWAGPARSGDVRLQYVTSQRMIADAVNLLLPQVPSNLAAVVGVPRSGMPAASILALQLQLPLCTVKGGEIIEVGAGSRGRQGWAGHRAGPLLFVDDSVYGGDTFQRLRVQFEGRGLFAAVYVRPEAAGAADLFARELPSPHLFEWNLFNGAPLIGRTINPILHGGIALDFDGVICMDPTVSDSDEAGYLRWLEDAPPLHLPRRHHIPLVVTFRLEKYRAATLAWMERWGVKAARLVMHPAASHAERSFDAAEHKGIAYRDSPCRLFIESDRRQAEQIHAASGKPVLALGTGEIFQ